MLTEEDAKLQKSLIYRDAASGARKGYFNPRRLMKNIMAIDEEISNGDDDVSTMEMIKKMAETSTKKDDQINALLEQNNKLLKRLNK